MVKNFITCSNCKHVVATVHGGKCVFNGSVSECKNHDKFELQDTWCINCGTTLDGGQCCEDYTCYLSGFKVKYFRQCEACQGVVIKTDTELTCHSCGIQVKVKSGTRGFSRDNNGMKKGCTGHRKNIGYVPVNGCGDNMIYDQWKSKEFVGHWVKDNPVKDEVLRCSACNNVINGKYCETNGCVLRYHSRDLMKTCPECHALAIPFKDNFANKNQCKVCGFHYDHWCGNCVHSGETWSDYDYKTCCVCVNADKWKEKVAEKSCETCHWFVKEGSYITCPTISKDGKHRSCNPINREYNKWEKKDPTNTMPPDRPKVGCTWTNPNGIEWEWTGSRWNDESMEKEEKVKEREKDCKTCGWASDNNGTREAGETMYCPTYRRHVGHERSSCGSENEYDEWKSVDEVKKLVKELKEKKEDPMVLVGVALDDVSIGSEWLTDMIHDTNPCISTNMACDSHEMVPNDTTLRVQGDVEIDGELRVNGKKLSRAILDEVKIGDGSKMGMLEVNDIKIKKNGREVIIKGVPSGTFLSDLVNRELITVDQLKKRRGDMDIINDMFERKMTLEESLEETIKNMHEKAKELREAVKNKDDLTIRDKKKLNKIMEKMYEHVRQAYIDF